MNFTLYVPGTHLHLEPESHLVYYHHKQPLTFKKYCYTYHQINSIMTPSDSIITRPMHMCSWPKLTHLVNSKEGPRSILFDRRNCFTIVCHLETRNTCLCPNYERDPTQTLVIPCTLFSVIHQGQRNAINHRIPHQTIQNIFHFLGFSFIFLQHRTKL